MEKKNTPIEEPVKEPEGKLMTRKQAIKKSGYMALSAATMLLLLNDAANGQQATSKAPSNPNSTSVNNQKGIWDD